MSIINDAGQTIVRCQFCAEECRSDQISYITINGQVWKVGPFCKHFATEETASQLLSGIHPNNIEIAYGKIIANEWKTGDITYIG